MSIDNKLKYKKGREQKFPNGFLSWIETHHEVVSAITIQNLQEEGLSYKTNCSQGTGGVYELAEDLTDKFERLNKGREWDGEFFDEITEFLEKELKLE